MTRLWTEGRSITTWGGAEAPTGFEWRGRAHRIQDFCNRWHIHTRWWEPAEAVWRQYLKVATDTGLLCLIYQDLPKGSWFLARLYD
jgi:hypothetical protein